MAIRATIQAPQERQALRVAVQAGGPQALAVEVAVQAAGEVEPTQVE